MKPIRLFLLLSIAAASGIYIGIRIAEHNSRSTVEDFHTLKEVLSHIHRDYVEEVNTKDLVQKTIHHLLEELDPHSAYTPAEDHEYFQSRLKGNFEGIGIEYNILRDTIYVITPLNGGPSEKAGLRSGDKIIKVNGDLVAGVGIKNRNVLDKLRGTKGSKVTVSVQRQGKADELDFDIIRDKIPQRSVDAAYMIDGEQGYIKINRFAATTYDEFVQALEKLKSKGLQKLILDLTNNTGGYMNVVIDIADEFLPDDAMIVFTKSKASSYDQTYRAHKKGRFEDQPLIILINESSASASEILSGAIQDNDRGLVVGRRSFGKGLVQKPIELSDGSGLRLTISRYYTPSGRSIQKPYHTGNKVYHEEIHQRYLSGEMYSADKVPFNDSLKYKTAKGRTVYGGGGIMPDYFIPIDTTQRSDYINHLFTSNALREYAMTYANEHRKALTATGFEQYFDGFHITDKMLHDLTAVAEQRGLSDHKPSHTTQARIKTYLKAQIAQNLWGNKGFYPIVNLTNNIYEKALKLFGHADDLTKPSIAQP